MLSIIIISYNTKKLTVGCLNSIQKYLKDLDYEIIVVDNHSTDGSLQILQNRSDIQLISLKENLGFGRANNLAVKKAKGEFLLLLNSDTKFFDHSFAKNYNKLIKYPNNVYGALLKNADDSVQNSFGYIPTIGRVIAQFLFLDDFPVVKYFYKPYQQNNLSLYHQKREVEWVTGAFILISKKNYNQVGGFDSDFFMYGEEVDLFFRLKSQINSLKVIFEPKIQLYHYKGKSSLDGFAAAIEGEYQGLIKFYQKHYPRQINLLKLVLKLGALLRVGLFGIIRPENAKVYWRIFKKIK